MRISFPDSSANGFKRWSDAHPESAQNEPRLGGGRPNGSSAYVAAETAGARETHPRRAVEDHAQALYEASDPGGIPWSRRTRIVRDAWLDRARNQLRNSR